MLNGINHVQITIPDGQENAAREFYCDFLGLVEIEKPAILIPNGGFWIQMSDIQLHVGVESGVNRNLTKAHIAYEVQGLDDWREKLEGRGISIKQSQPIPGFRRFEFRDPFGNRVEFIEALTV